MVANHFWFNYSTFEERDYIRLFSISITGSDYLPSLTDCDYGVNSTCNLPYKMALELSFVLLTLLYRTNDIKRTIIVQHSCMIATTGDLFGLKILHLGLVALTFSVITEEQDRAIFS